MKNLRTIQEPVIKGKTWRSLDLANQSNINIYSQNPTTSSNVTTANSTNTSTTSVHHNSLINNLPIHYQRHDFKNRRSSSEPANEQKLLAHIQNSHNYTTISQNTNSNNINEDAPASIEKPSDDNPSFLIKVSKTITKQKSTKKHFPVLWLFYQLHISSF